jgi:hypothetical protein
MSISALKKEAELRGKRFSFSKRATRLNGNRRE